MGSKYNSKYKKGKWLSRSVKSRKADLAKTARVTEDEALWKSDTRKYDFPYRDTGPEFIFHREGKAASEAFRKHSFKYKRRFKGLTAKSGRKYNRYVYKDIKIRPSSWRRYKKK